MARCANVKIGTTRPECFSNGIRTMDHSKEDIGNDIPASALVSFPERLSRSSYEREILRVVSTIVSDYEEDILAIARDEVLKWALRRAGGELPDDAWRGSAFETLAAGRITMAASVETETGWLWSLRGDDPDKGVPGRSWSTEVSLGRLKRTSDVLLGVRLLVNSTEAQIDIEPSVPGLVLQIAEKFNLQDGPLAAWPMARLAETEAHVEKLADWLQSSARRLPIIVASGDERSEFPDRSTIDVDTLAKALCGLAHVVSLPASLTYKLSDLLGRTLSVFHGVSGFTSPASTTPEIQEIILSIWAPQRLLFQPRSPGRSESVLRVKASAVRGLGTMSFPLRPFAAKPRRSKKRGRSLRAQVMLNNLLQPTPGIRRSRKRSKDCEQKLIKHSSSHCRKPVVPRMPRSD
jgi:hypothetical protein